MTTELVRYDAMLHAIAECHLVDEIKQIHDQAAALEAAARVAMNTDAERKAIEIRIRAERQGGELMMALQKSKGGGDVKSENHVGRNGRSDSEYRETLERNRIPERTARRWQQLAEVPPERFEAHLEADDIPSTRAILESEKAKPVVSDEALWLWGRLRDFERMGLFGADMATLMEDMTEGMRADVRRLAPLVVECLNRCTEKELV